MRAHSDVRKERNGAMTNLLQSRNSPCSVYIQVAGTMASCRRRLSELLRAVHPAIVWRSHFEIYNYVALALSLSRPLLNPSPTSGQLLGAFTWAGSPSFVCIAQSRHIAWAPDRKQVFA